MTFNQLVRTEKARLVLFTSCFQPVLTSLFVIFIASAALPPSAAHADWRRRSNDAIEIKLLGRYSSAIFGPDAAGSESLAHDPRTQCLFVVNVANATIDVIDIKKPKEPKFLFAIDLTPFGKSANSVAVHKGIVAAAVQVDPKTGPGKAVFFDAHGMFLNAVQVGALPDMIVFTPDGEKVLVANEGEPNDDYTIDPEGSVSIIDISRGVRRLRQDDVVT